MIERITVRHINSRKEAHRLLASILSTNHTESSLCEFLGDLRNHPVSEELLAGFREAMMDRCITVEPGTRNCVDVCGTGGDGKHTFNISTLAALTAAAAGVPVIKHGNSAFSSTIGSSDILNEVGITMPKTPDEARSQFNRCGITFLHAPFFHPAMKSLGAARKKVGFRTIFNLLGPLCNPAQPHCQIIGVSHYEVHRLYRSYLSKRNISYSVLWDEGGYDEVSLTNRCFVTSNGREQIFSPKTFGGPVSPSMLSGGKSTHENKEIFLQIASGNALPEKLSVVAANAALAIAQFETTPVELAYTLALKKLRQGAVMDIIKKLQGECHA